MKYQLPHILSIETDALCDCAYSKNITDSNVMEALEKIPNLIDVDGIYVFSYSVNLEGCVDWYDIRIRCEEVVKNVEKVFKKFKVPRTSSIQNCTIEPGAFCDTLDIK